MLTNEAHKSNSPTTITSINQDSHQGINKARSPTRTYANGLQLDLQLQLFRYIVSAGGIHNVKKPSSICDLNTNLFGAPNSKQRNKVRRKISSWQSLSTQQFNALEGDLLRSIHKQKEEKEEQPTPRPDTETHKPTYYTSTHNPTIQQPPTMSVPSDYSSSTGSSAPWGNDDLSDCRKCFSFVIQLKGKNSRCFLLVSFCGHLLSSFS